MKKVKWFQVLLCITNNSFNLQRFVYTQLNDQSVIFQTIQFSIFICFALSLNVKQFYLTHRWTLGTEWIQEWWQWKGTLHSPKLRHYWSLTIRLFSVISRALVGRGFTPLQRCRILQLQLTGLSFSIVEYQDTLCSPYTENEFFRI